MNVKRIVWLLLAIYAILFIARTGYSIAVFDEENMFFGSSVTTYLTGEKLYLNIASSRYEYVSADGVEILDQKYEKVASVGTKTARYAEDERSVYAAIEECLAVIQKENRSGLEGSRRLDLVIGVKPDHFDGAVERIRAIGTVTSFRTVKTDKTYEYRRMLAERDKHLKQIESYEALKSKGGSITEMLTVEDRIIEVEALLREQSVTLGAFSEDNALCTIEFSMYEGRMLNIFLILWDALVWSTGLYLISLGILLLTCAAAFITLTVWKVGKKIYDTHKNGE
ncbi:MAG: DUF4349 domain-containing protein [Oscillospiraceae bacterium]|jgi:hypothetical protein|nr:DUF4349 domain-containing protein [Oscillospiraceae bacterium]